jgi:hypothetical protein
VTPDDLSEAPGRRDPRDLSASPEQAAEAPPRASDDLSEAPGHDDLSDAPGHDDLSHAPGHDDLSEAPCPDDLSHAPGQPDLTEAPGHDDLSHAPGSPAPSDIPPVAPDLRAGLAAPLFQAEDCGPRLRIVTPFALPDGDLLVLFALRHSDPPLLGDLGETLRWLRSHTSAARRSEGLQQRILEICTGLGVELERGELRTHTRAHEPLALALVRLAQACLRVSELWRNFRPRPTSSLLDEIDAELRSKLPTRPLSITRGDRIAGISATTWSVDFRVRTAERHTLIFVLASERREHARKLAEHVVAACTDLAHLRKLRRTPVQFLAVFDDRGEAWSDAEARLVAPFATPCKWSDRAVWLPSLATPFDELDDYDEPDDEDTSEHDASDDAESDNKAEDDTAEDTEDAANASESDDGESDNKAEDTEDAANASESDDGELEHRPHDNRPVHEEPIDARRALHDPDPDDF